MKIMSVILLAIMCGLITISSANNGGKNNNLPTRYIAKLDRHVTFFGLGTVELGRRWGIDPNNSAVNSEQSAKNVLQTAINVGFNLIDTASSYGLSELRIGRYIPQSKYNYLLISKPGEHSLKANDPRCKKPALNQIYCDYPAAAYDFSPAAIKKDIATSLKNLKVKTLDVALLHLQLETALAVLKNGEALKTLENLKTQGKIKYIGVSVNGPAALYAVKHTNIDVIELEYNLLNQTNAAAIAMAHKKGIGVIVRGGLATGLLTEQVAKHLTDPKLPYRDQIKALLKLVNNDYDRLTALAIGFLYANPNISSVILGADQTRYLEKDIYYLKNFNDPALLQLAQQEMAKYPSNSEFTDMMGEFYSDFS